MSIREDAVIVMQEGEIRETVKRGGDRGAEPRWEVRMGTHQDQEHPQTGLGPLSVLEVRPFPDNVIQCLSRGQDVGHITVAH